MEQRRGREGDELGSVAFVERSDHQPLMGLIPLRLRRESRESQWHLERIDWKGTTMTSRYYERTTTVLVVSRAITAANQFTDDAEFDIARPFNVSVSGTFAATVTLQRSFDNGGMWQDVWSTSLPAEEIVDNVEPDVLWRLGCKGSEHSSGTVQARMSQ